MVIGAKLLQKKNVIFIKNINPPTKVTSPIIKYRDKTSHSLHQSSGQKRRQMQIFQYHFRHYWPSTWGYVRNKHSNKSSIVR